MALPNHLKRKPTTELPEETTRPAESVLPPENPIPSRDMPAGSAPSWDIPVSSVPTWDTPADTPAAPEPAPVSVPEPMRPAAYYTPPAPVRPAAAPAPSAFAEELQPGAGIPERLELIDRRLSELNDQLAEVGIAVLDCREKTSDPELMYTKLGSVHHDIKKLRDELSADRTAELMAQLQAMTDRQEKTERMLTQALRENATFQQQVRQGMQHDLDELRTQLSGASFNPILKEIANMYCEYQLLLEDTEISDKSRRNLTALFGQMEDLLADYDAEVVVSKVGDERPKRQCRIINQVPTGDESMHNTIAKSRRPGVIRDRQVLYHEFVDVFVYDPALDPAAEATREADAAPVEPPTPLD